MRPRVLSALMLTLALTLTGGSSVAVASTKAKCGTSKAACKPASTAQASRSQANRQGANRAAGRQTANRPAAGKQGANRQAANLAAKKKQQQARARAVSEPVTLRLDEHGLPRLNSSAFYVVNQNTGEVLLQRNAHHVMPIASITKLMTAIVVVESGSSLDEVLTITSEDIDTLKGTTSRLAVGTQLTRREMLLLSLMSSENRAASALGRHYPGGRTAFLSAMNAKARLIGMSETRFYDTTGLTPRNVSSPRDLSRLVAASSAYPLIREFSTTSERYLYVNGQSKRFGNSNGLVRSPDWNISVSKTGFISEAGRCLVMQAWMQDQPLLIVLLAANDRSMRVVDAQRVRLWLEESPERLAATRQGPQG